MLTVNLHLEHAESFPAGLFKFQISGGVFVQRLTLGMKSELLLQTVS